MEVERSQSHVESQARAEIDAGLRSYMLSVYNYMGLGLALTGIVAFVTSQSPALLTLISGTAAFWVLFVVIMLLGMASSRLILSGNLAMAHAAFWTYAGLWGLWITPYLLIYTQSSIVRAFFITSATFFGASLYGYVTKRDLTAMGRFLVMATIGLVIAMIVNIFTQSEGFSFILSLLVVLVFSGLTAYETQEIKNSYYSGDSEITAKSKAIMGAFLLYGKFIVIFIHILRLVGDRR